MPPRRGAVDPWTCKVLRTVEVFPPTDGILNAGEIGTETGGVGNREDHEDS